MRFSCFFALFLVLTVSGCSTKTVSPEGEQSAQKPTTPTSQGIQSEAAKADFVDPATGMEFVQVKGGCFPMGSLTEAAPENAPLNRMVCVGDFWVGKYEVTQEEWGKLATTNPSAFQKGGDYPVDNVSWNQTQLFLAAMTSQGDKEFRLPTEAEWEYAARSGGRNERWAGTTAPEKMGDFVWHRNNYGKHFHSNRPVGQKLPNGLGLYDMNGNVEEWCNDTVKADSTTKFDGEEPEAYRAVRGGGWYNLPQDMSTILKGHAKEEESDLFRGFRVVFSAKE